MGEKNKNSKRITEKIKLLINLKNISIFLCFIGLVGLVLINVFLRVEDEIKMVILSEILSVACEILISVFGVAAIIESTNLKDISKSVIEEATKNFVEKTSQIDYVKKNYTKEMKRELLYLSFSDEDYFDKDNKAANFCTTKSFEDYIEYLITAVYAEKDEATITFEFEKDYIKKTMVRTLVLVNNFHKENNFQNGIYFNLTEKEFNEAEEITDEIKGKCSQTVKLDYIKINEVCMEIADIFHLEKNNDKNSNTYKFKALFERKLCDRVRHTIEYRMVIKMPIDDKMSIFSAKYLSETFCHKIIMIENQICKDLDISLFSMAKSTGIKKKSFTCIPFMKDKGVGYEIKSTDWLFPGGGYSILFK